MKRNSFINAKEYVLENGVMVVTIKKDTKLSSVHIGLKVGSLYEGLEEKGICHFIEHMLFKGTKKRDNNKINQDLEETAGGYDAYTDYLSTVLSITALCDELESSIEVLSDIIINSTFPQEEIEKERKVILTEIKASIDDVEQYSYRRVHELAFDKSPLKYDVIGTEESIKKITRERLLSFYSSYYIPDRCVISIASPYEHDYVKEIVEKYFDKWGKADTKEIKILEERNQSVEKISYKNNIEQNTLIYLYTFYRLTRKEEIALDILNHKLGESPNSILFRALREERGLAYDIYSQLDTTDWVKTLYIYTAVDEKDIWKSKKIIDECIDKIKMGEIKLEERDISIMKKVIKTSIASLLEDSQGLSSYALHQKLMNKKIDGFMEDLKILKHIDEKDIYKVAQKVLVNPTIHILMRK